MPHISYSAFKNWTTCPYYYKLTYEDRVSLFNGNIYTAFGTAIHSACEDILMNTDVDLIVQFQESFKRGLKELPEDVLSKMKSSDIKDFYSQGVMLIQHIMPEVKRYFGEKIEVFSVEEDLMVNISDFDNLESEYKFKGFIDLVLKTPDGKYHILDWKTCSWGWNAEKRSDKIVNYQLTFYKHYFCQKHNIDPSLVETHFGLLKRTAKNNNVEIFRITSGAQKTKNALSILNNALFSIDNKNFIKNKSACSRCEFSQTEYCTNGKRTNS